MNDFNGACPYSYEDKKMKARIQELEKLTIEMIENICTLCRRLNPQHSECTSCDDIKAYRATLKEGGNEKRSYGVS